MSPPDAGWAPSSDFWQDRPTLVTGATGFLGSHLVAMLAGLGAAVVALVRDEPAGRPLPAGVSVAHGDVTDQALVERVLGDYEVATVIHLAAQSQVQVANRNPVPTFESNIKGTWAVLEAARRSPALSQMVVASSDKAYGAQPALPYREDMALLAVHPYDVSKACADLLASCYHRVYSLPVCITRCANLFGPGDTNWSRLVPSTVRALLGGQRPVIRSDGSPVRDWLYVADAALGCLRLVEAMDADEALVGQAFNFSSETPLSVLELVAMISKAAGVGDLEPTVVGQARHEIDAQHLSAERARSTLGWVPTYDLADALALTVKWYRDHLGDQVRRSG